MKKKPLRVLMANRPEKAWLGGDWVKLNKVAAELRKQGAHVDVFEMQKLGMAEWYGFEDYDIIHTWNFSMDWSKYAVWLAGKKKKKIVSSMVYFATDKFIPYDLQQVMMDHMDACIYETEAEVERAKKHLKVKNTRIVGNGIDPWWFEPSGEKAPLKDYLLTVGRIEPNKGQLEAAMAAKDLGLKYVCIGGTGDKEYVSKCVAEGAMVLPNMSQEKLKPWYAGCAAYLQPSLSETWGMAVDEAGSQGAKIIASTGFERIDIPGAAFCDHESRKSIRDAAEWALKQPKSEKFRDMLKKRTWADVASDYKEIYESI